ncbi:hypothetical protein HDU97_009097, partial [Phlyctochytrium planicorne]
MIFTIPFVLAVVSLGSSLVRAVPTSTLPSFSGQCLTKDQAGCEKWFEEFGVAGKYSNYTVASTTEHKLEGRDGKIYIQTIVDASDLIDVGALDLNWVISNSWNGWWQTGVNVNFNGAIGNIRTQCTAPTDSDVTRGDFWIGGEWAQQARGIDGWELGKVLIGGAGVALKNAASQQYAVVGPMRCTGGQCWGCGCQPQCDTWTAYKVPRKMRVIARDGGNWGAQVGEIVIEFKDWTRYGGICGLKQHWETISSLDG